MLSFVKVCVPLKLYSFFTTKVDLNAIFLSSLLVSALRFFFNRQNHHGPCLVRLWPNAEVIHPKRASFSVVRRTHPNLRRARSILELLELFA